MAKGSARGRDWKRVRERVLRDATVCHLCGGLLDFDAPPRSPRAPSVDHVVPLAALAGADPRSLRALTLDPGNLRPAHYGCNSRRGAGRVAKPRSSSREW